MKRLILLMTWGIMLALLFACAPDASDTNSDPILSSAESAVVSSALSSQWISSGPISSPVASSQASSQLPDSSVFFPASSQLVSSRIASSQPSSQLISSRVTSSAVSSQRPSSQGASSGSSSLSSSSGSTSSWSFDLAEAVFSNLATADFLDSLESCTYNRIAEPEFVMVHFMSAVCEHPEDPYDLEYVRALFTEYSISVHYLVDRSGTIYCYVPENLAAWHAGKGTWGDNEQYTNAMNHYSIGIEVMGIGSESDMAIYMTAQAYQELDDSLKGFTQAQYDALKELIADLCNRYDIPADRDHVIGHEEYSPQKTDPGELFEWDRVLDLS